MSSSGDDGEARGGFLVEGGGEVSAAPVGWRERRFVVVMWIDVGISYYGIWMLERGILIINTPNNVMELDEVARWGFRGRKGFKDGGSFRGCT